jgi:hypothetical protein
MWKPPKVWDETSGSNDGEYSEPENVTYHKGEKIQHIGCVYQKINLEGHYPLAVDRRFGKTPMQTFLDAMPIAKEKMIAA